MLNAEDQVEKLEVKLEDSRRETIKAISSYKMLINDYNKLVTDHNQTAANLQVMMTFLLLQCGILRTAITDDICEDPLAPVSILQVGKGVEDLLYLFNGNLMFINAIKSGKSVAEALELWKAQI